MFCVPSLFYLILQPALEPPTTILQKEKGKTPPSPLYPPFSTVLLPVYLHVVPLLSFASPLILSTALSRHTQHLSLSSSCITATAFILRLEQSPLANRSSKLTILSTAFDCTNSSYAGDHRRGSIHLSAPRTDDPIFQFIVGLGLAS